MRKVWALLLFAFFSLTSIAQIKVQIIDAESNYPISQVNVNFYLDSNYYLLSDNKGFIEIPNSSQNFLITFEKTAYQTRSIYKEYLKDNNFIIALKPEAISFNPIVVSASKWKERLNEQPFKITSISSENIKLFSPQNTADALFNSGDVFVQKSQQAGGSPMIRGFSANRVLITIDGLRFNNAIFRSGNLQNIINIDPFIIDNTEIIFGPGSVLYGSDAIGGVMNIKTKDPILSINSTQLLVGSAQTRFSSANNELSSHFNINLGYKKWAFLSAFSFNRFGNLTMGTNGPDDYLSSFEVKRQDSIDIKQLNNNPLSQLGTAYNQFNITQKIKFKPNKYSDWDYSLFYSETSTYGRFDRLSRQRNNQPISAEWNYGPQLWNAHVLSFKNNKRNYFYDELSAKTAYQKFEESRIDRDFNDPIRRTKLDQVNVFNLNLDLSKHINSNIHLSYGLEWVYNQIKSSGNELNINNLISNIALARYPNAQYNSGGIYSALKIKLKNNNHIHAALRYSLFNIQADFSYQNQFFPILYNKLNSSFNSINGNLGWIKIFKNSFQVHVLFSNGFRAPNIDDIGKVFDSEPGAVIVPNINLKPEIAYNFETGISKIWNNKVKIETGIFYTYLGNAMVRRPFQFNGSDSIIYNNVNSQIFAIQNAAFAFVYGAFLTFNAKLNNGFSLSVKANYQYGREQMGDETLSPLRHVAPAFGMAQLNYDIQKLRLMFNFFYNAEVSYNNLSRESQNSAFLFAKDQQGRPYSPSWYTLNLKFIYAFEENFNLNGGIENISDIRYRTYTSGISAAGRNFVLGLMIKF